MSASRSLNQSASLDEIKAGLLDNLEAVAEIHLGQPNAGTRQRKEWEWGRKGSRKLVVRGPKRGAFFSHEAAAGGGPLDLIMDAKSCGITEAIQWARDWLNLSDGHRPAVLVEEARRERERRQKASAAAEAAERHGRILAARSIVKAAQTIRMDDPAWLYLIGRGIPGEAIETATNAGVLLYHRSRGAVVFVATNLAGDVQGVQLVHVTADGLKRKDERSGLVKMSRGDLEGAVVRLPGDALNLQLAEGPETGMTVWGATRRETWIALGSISKVQPPSGQRLLVCADDDARHSPSAKALSRAIARWRADGHTVTMVVPWAERRFDGTDFNNVAMLDGIDAVRTRIEEVVCPPGPPLEQRLPAAKARLKLKAAIRAFFEEASAFLQSDHTADGVSPIVHAIRGAVGLGKSKRMRRAVAQLLTEMRARGDRRSIAIAGPTHKLNREQIGLFNELPEAQAAGLTADIWIGRTARDKETSAPLMCQDIEAVLDAQGLGLPVEESACLRRVRRPKGDKSPREFRCPFYETCAFQAQKRRTADLWFVPHELIFTEKPEAIGTLALLIVDESCWQDGLEGVEGKPITLSLEALSSSVSLPNIDSQRALRDIYALTTGVLAAQPDGNLQRDAALAAGLSADIAKEGRALTWDRKVDPKLRPGMSGAERRAAMKPAIENRTIMRTARLFNALQALLQDDGPDASGWIVLTTEDTEHGPVRVVRLKGRRDIKKGWLVPTLLLDATLNANLVRPFWNQVQVTAEIEAETPHMRVTQMIGRDWPKTALVPDAYCNEEEARRRLKNSRNLRAAVLRSARRTNGRALVVVQKAVEDYWRSLGCIPSNVEFAHHNDVAGRDEWGPGPDREGVRLLIVIGRTSAPPADVERLTEALTGRAVTNRLCGRYDRNTVPLHMSDGSVEAAEADSHPDPIAEAIRWQICEGELIQIIGRPRGVNRTEENPVDVLLLTDRPLPLPVDQTVTWEELAPSHVDLMLAEGGVAFTDAADAARAYPALWPNRDGSRCSPEAARKAFQRARCGTSPIKDTPYWGMSRTSTQQATYQVAGAGRRETTVEFDPDLVPDIEGWLTKHLKAPVTVTMVDGQNHSEHARLPKRAAAPSVPVPQDVGLIALSPQPSPTVAVAAQMLPMPTQAAHASSRPILLPDDAKLAALGSRLTSTPPIRPFSPDDPPANAPPRGGGPVPDRPLRHRSED